MKIIFFTYIFFASGFGFAVESKPATHVLLSVEEIALQAKARKRLYPGGRDEEPLTVQAQLQQPVRKFGPATEAPEDEPHD